MLTGSACAVMTVAGPSLMLLPQETCLLGFNSDGHGDRILGQSAAMPCPESVGLARVKAWDSNSFSRAPRDPHGPSQPAGHGASLQSGLRQRPLSPRHKLEAATGLQPGPPANSHSALPPWR